MISTVVIHGVWIMLLFTAWTWGHGIDKLAISCILFSNLQSLEHVLRKSSLAQVNGQDTTEKCERVHGLIGPNMHTCIVTYNVSINTNETCMHIS